MGASWGRNWKLLRLSMGKSNGQLCTAQLHEHVEQEEDGRRQGRCACDVLVGHPTPAVLASIESPAWRSLPAMSPPLLQLPCSTRRDCNTGRRRELRYSARRECKTSRRSELRCSPGRECKTGRRVECRCAGSSDPLGELSGGK
jgi:hypothetical protein